jgi:L-arabinokinase
MVCYVSGHGFGHASRVIEVINAVGRQSPGVTLVVRTGAARWLFDATLQTPVEFHHVLCDAGVVQTDSLHLDIQDTIREASRFQAAVMNLAGEEAEFLRVRGADVVLGDIPPLAFEAAARAGVPSVGLGNFTWDWIYEAYPETQHIAPELPALIRRHYARATLALRLPMWGGFAGWTAPILDVPFIARHSTREPAEVRAKLRIPIGHRMVLVSFGGLGIDGLRLEPLARLDGYTIVTTGHALHIAGPKPPGVVLLDDREVYAMGLRYEDLVRASEVVVTKPGYGIIAECLANDTALLYTSRGRFAEYDVLVEAMPRFLRCAYIGHGDLFAGRWQPHLDRLLDQPRPATRPPTDGAEIAARIMLAVAGGANVTALVSPAALR